ncbi:MAG: hypothetical protein OXG11_10250 [Chloroflexi bacterium]|nr:hypothetical protein [Chloroflexota bacterium]
MDLARRLSPFGVNYVVNAQTINDLDEAAKLAFGKGAVEMLLLPERSTGDRDGIDEVTRRTLSEWVGSNRHYRLAIPDGYDPGSIPIANPFHDIDPLQGYAHIDASCHLRVNAYSPVAVKIRSSIGDAVGRLRSHSGSQE